MVHMAGARTPRRTRVNLEVAGPDTTPVAEVRAPAVPWPMAAILGAILCAAAGWLLVTAPVVVSALSVADVKVAPALSLGTQIWLLSHGAGATVAGTPITLVPLAITALLVVMAHGVSSFAARQAQLSYPDDDMDLDARRLVASRVTGCFTASYAVTVAVVSFAVSTPSQTARALVGAALLALVASLAGAARTVRWTPQDRWPTWARSIPRAVAAAVSVVIIGGCLALGWALVGGRERMVELSAALEPGTVGAVVLLLVQVAVVPNLVLWAGSWTLGAGFSVGEGSVVSPTVTHLGLLPGLPITGALPDPATAQWHNVWWLVVGVVAGGVAALVVARSRPRARLDETALVGGLVGMLAGLGFTAVAALSGGALGSQRLLEVGPRLVELVVMATTVMGLSGMAVGLGMGLLRRQPAGRPDGRDGPMDQVDDGDEETRQLRRPVRAADEETRSLRRRPGGDTD